MMLNACTPDTEYSNCCPTLAKIFSHNYYHILVLQWLTASNVLAQKCHICLLKILIQVRYDIKSVLK